jgi:hypothetical protein
MFSFFLRSRCCTRVINPSSVLLASTSVITTTTSISSFSIPSQQKPKYPNTTSSQISVAAASAPALWMATRFATGNNTSRTVEDLEAKIKQLTEDKEKLESDKKELQRQLDQVREKIKNLELDRSSLGFEKIRMNHEKLSFEMKIKFVEDMLRYTDYEIESLKQEVDLLKRVQILKTDITMLKQTNERREKISEVQSFLCDHIAELRKQFKRVYYRLLPTDEQNEISPSIRGSNPLEAKDWGKVPTLLNDDDFWGGEQKRGRVRALKKLLLEWKLIDETFYEGTSTTTEITLDTEISEEEEEKLILIGMTLAAIGDKRGFTALPIKKPSTEDLELYFRKYPRYEIFGRNVIEALAKTEKKTLNKR